MVTEQPPISFAHYNQKNEYESIKYLQSHSPSGETQIGKLSLYLDFYPPIWNPNIKKMSRREFLGLYLIAEPQDKFVVNYNETILIKARGIRAQREMAIINEEFGFIDKTKKHADFLADFEEFVKKVFVKPFESTAVKTIEQKLRESKSTKERIPIHTADQVDKLFAHFQRYGNIKLSILNKK